MLGLPHALSVHRAEAAQMVRAQKGEKFKALL